jgi:translocator protein
VLDLKRWMGLFQVVAIGLPQILGALSGAASSKSVATWYKNDVRKPSWHPPLPLFGFIWPVLYLFMGFASYVVYVEAGGFRQYAGPLALYAAQLLLNVAWQPLFFNVRNWRLAQLDNIGRFL